MKHTEETHRYQLLDGIVKEIYSQGMGEEQEETDLLTATTPAKAGSSVRTTQLAGEQECGDDGATITYRRVILCGWPDGQRGTASQAIICIMAVILLVVVNLCMHAGIAQAATRASLTSGTLTSSPVAGPTQAILTVSGSGWQKVADGTVVNFGFSIAPICTSATYTPAATEQAGVMSGGAFSGWFLWPAKTQEGAYTVCALIGSTPVAAGSYTVLSAKPPQLTISSSTFTVGQQAMVSGSNFLPPQTSITLILQQLSGGTGVPVGTATSDANGAFSQTITLPANPTGPVELIANAGSGTPPTLSASATFIVYAAPATATPTATTTPSPSPSPSPTPVPGKTATPAVGKTATPTSIPSPQTQMTPTITASPISLGSQPQAPTPTSSSQSVQQTVAQTPTTSKQSSGKLTPVLITGAVFVMLAAVLAILILRRKARKQISQPAFRPTITSAGSLDRAASWGMAQPMQPSASWTSAANWGNAPVQQASPSYPVTQSNTNENTNADMAFAAQTYRTGQMPEVPGTSEVAGNGMPAGTPDILPPSATTSQSSDLLQDPLLAAIMQQAHSGLFVLPGKKV